MAPRPSVATGRAYLASCALVVLAGLVLSLGVLCIRAAATSEAWQYLFWRAVGFALALAVVAAWRHRTNPLAQVRRLDAIAWLSVAAMVASQVWFIAAMKSGSTAEVFFLMSLAPLMTAVLARPLLGERIGLLGMLAIAVALAGVALMSGLSVGGGNGADGGDTNWTARILALACAFAFALYSIATRRARREDLDAALLAVGGVTALICALLLAWQGMALVSSLRDVALALLHGGVILAIGLVLFAAGSRALPGVTLVMLAQAETIAAPIWTWLAFDETTTRAVIAGGALILVAVVMQAADGAGRDSQRDVPAPTGGHS